VVDHGPESTEPEHPAGVLFLIHGAHGNWHHWRANIKSLSRTHRVIVPDMPGFGLSDALPESGLDELAQSLSGVADALSLPSVSLVGYSFGALVATTLAAARPDLVKRLLLINPPGWRERSPQVMAAQVEAAMHNRTYGIRAALAFTLRRIMLRNHSVIDEACLDVSEAAARSLRLVTKDISRSADLIKLLALVAVPWHVIFSEEDPYHCHWLDDRCSRLQALRGQTCTTVVAEAQHWVQQDRPAALNRLIAQFADPGQRLEMPSKV